MTYITLPGFIENFNLNVNFLNYCNERKKECLPDQKTFFTIYGTLPQNSYGGNQIRHNNYILYNNLFNILEEYHMESTVLRFDCSNLLIDVKDYNVFNKILLEFGNNGGNQIEVSTKDSYEFFKNNYPDYDIVWSQFSIDFPEETNDIIVRNSLNSNIPSLNYNKNKIEYMFNYPCEQCSTETWGKCVISEHENINNFSNKSILLDCPKYNNYSLFERDLKLKRFQLALIPEKIKQLESYILLLKPEFRNEARMYCLQRI